MTDKAPQKRLGFGDTAKFVTDEIGLKGTIVLGVFEDGRIGITTDGLTGMDVQSVLATGIYINQADIIKRHEAANV